MSSNLPSSRRSLRGPAAVLPFLLAAACGGSTPYVYTPDQATVQVDGQPGTREAIPPEQPQGDVRVASYGVTEVTPTRGGPSISALHIRMDVSNNGDANPWQIDTRQQQAFIDGEGSSTPLYVNTDERARASLPFIYVAMRERRTLDFYFPLPATVSSADKLPSFDFLWTIKTGARVVADRTQFTRQEVRDDRVYANVTVLPGWGPWWWYNPGYGGMLWHHPRTIVIHDRTARPGVQVAHPRHMYVGQPGRTGRRAR
jgi:hypothetical protein